MKKKMMALLLSAVTVLSAATLTGCGQKASDGDSNSADGSSGQPVKEGRELKATAGGN